MSANALVTGGAGFLGSHLCERLLADGWRVWCADNLATGRERNLRSFAANPSFSFHQVDVSEEPLPGDALDVVFHLACPASPVQYNRLPIETLEVSAFGTARALERAARDEAAFVLASTSEVYGDPLVHPQTESYWGNVDPVGPRSMYDEGKRFAEALATWHARERAVDARIVRIFNTYGPRMDLWDGRVVSTFVRQALAGEPLSLHGDGSQTRSFCYVSDMVEALVRVGVPGAGVIGSSPINLGNPVEKTIRQIAEAVVAAPGSSSVVDTVDRPPGAPSRRIRDITRARSLLGC